MTQTLTLILLGATQSAIQATPPRMTVSLCDPCYVNGSLITTDKLPLILSSADAVTLDHAGWALLDIQKTPYGSIGEIALVNRTAVKLYAGPNYLVGVALSQGTVDCDVDPWQGRVQVDVGGTTITSEGTHFTVSRFNGGPYTLRVWSGSVVVAVKGTMITQRVDAGYGIYYRESLKWGPQFNLMRSTSQDLASHNSLHSMSSTATARRPQVGH